MSLKQQQPSLIITVAIVLGLSVVMGYWLSSITTGPTEQLSAQVASAQGNVCGKDTIAAAVVLELETWKPKRIISRDEGKSYQLRGTPGEVFRGGVTFESGIFSTYERTFLLEVFDDACSNCKMILNGQEVGTITGKTDFKNEPRGGKLINKVEGNFSSRQAQYVLFELEKKSITLPPQQISDDDQVIDLGKLTDLLGSDYIGQTDPPTLQKVTVTVTGRAKASLGDIDKNVFTVNETEMNQNVFICKDSLGNNDICDFQECTTPVITPTAHCSDGIDNDGDGKIDFPEDPGCNDSSDGDETDPPPPTIGRSISLSGTRRGEGTSAENLYPLGIQTNFPNNIYVKARVGNRFEMVQMNPTILPAFGGTQPTNASLHYYLLRGKDSEGKEHLSVMQGRFWDPSSFADSSRTSDPWFSYFALGGDLSTCVAEMGNIFSAVPFYLDNPLFFQQMIEMLTLCQRGASGATPNPDPTSGAVLLSPGPSAVAPAPSPVTPSSTGVIGISFSGTTSPTGISPSSLTTPSAGSVSLLPGATTPPTTTTAPAPITPKTLTAIFSLSGGGNQFLYQDINTPPDFTLPATSCLEYDLFLPTAETRISFDLTFTNGSNLRDTGTIDLNGQLSHPAHNLSVYALNQFYERVIPLTNHAGKTIAHYDIAAEYDAPGSQTARFRDIQITDCSGNTLVVIYDGTPFSHNPHLTNSSSNSVSFIHN